MHGIGCQRTVPNSPGPVHPLAYQALLYSKNPNCIASYSTLLRSLTFRLLYGCISKHVEAAVGVLDQDVVIAVPLLECVDVLHAAATAAVDDAANFSARCGSARALQRCPCR